MYVVYEPKGRAFEYSPLACNLYMGCTHGCRYCYAPGCMRKKAEEWHSSVSPRKDVIALFKRDAEKLRGDSRKILFCFLSDPYQPLEGELHLTRKALEICCKNHLKTQILTKGSYKLIQADLDLMKQAKTELGITLCFSDDSTRKKWEPEAATVEERLNILREAYDKGIYTWISLEPVIIPEQALKIIELAAPYVNFWKIGKLNHMKDVESQVDWKNFALDAKAMLDKLKAKYYFKESLQQFLS